MLVRFLSCRDRFRLKYIHGLEPPDKWNHKMGYGNMWHVCEEAMAKVETSGTGSTPLYNWRSELEKHTRELNSRYPFQQDEIMKWFNVCKVQFPEYVKYWQNHPDVLNRKPLLQEQVFDVPYRLPSGRTVRLRGKWDSVDLITVGRGCAKCYGHGWHYTNATEDYVGDPEVCPHCSVTGIWLQENKTKGDIDKEQVERQLKFDLQTMLYLTALKEIREQSSRGDTENPIPEECAARLLLGVRYNVVRRPLSGGKGNISPHKTKYTKHKITPAETPEAFYERLRRDYIAHEPSYWFFRVRAEISQSEIDTFRKTCLDPLLEHLCWWYDQFTNSDYNKPMIYASAYGPPPMNYRTPFGVWSALEEGGATEYDAYLQGGMESGLRRVNELFTELK